MAVVTWMMVVGACAGTVDPASWGALREAVSAATAAEGCGFVSLPEYCPREADEIDPVLRRLVDKHYNGSVPVGAVDRTDLIAYARTDLVAAMRTAAGLRRLEQRIGQRFRTPVVSRQAGHVSINLGAVPGTLQSRPRQPISLANSPHVVAGEWRSTEAATALARFATEHPDAAIVDVVVLVVDARRARWTYRLDRARHRVLVFNDLMPTGAYVTDGHTDSSLTGYIDGRRSLHTANLRWLRTAQVPR